MQGWSVNDLELSSVKQTKNMVNPHPMEANMRCLPYRSEFSLPSMLRTAESASVILGQQKNSPMMISSRNKKNTLRMSFRLKIVYENVGDTLNPKKEMRCHGTSFQLKDSASRIRTHSLCFSAS